MNAWAERVEQAARGIPARLMGLLDPIRFMPTDTEECHAAFIRHEAPFNCIRTAIAMRLFADAEGRPGHCFRELVPRYMERELPDPFTGESLLLVREDGMVTVYSVGENLRDDGGRLTCNGERLGPDTGIRIAE
jgi:hypothetical protein